MHAPVPDSPYAVYYSARNALLNFFEQSSEIKPLLEKYLTEARPIWGRDIVSLYHHLFLDDHVTPYVLDRINSALSIPLTPERLADFKAEIHALPNIEAIREGYGLLAVGEKQAYAEYHAWSMAQEAARAAHTPGHVEPELPPGHPPVAIAEEAAAALPKAQKGSLLKRGLARIREALGGRKVRADVPEAAPALSQKDLAALGYLEEPLADLPKPAPYPEIPAEPEYLVGDHLADLPAPERRPAAPAGGSGITVGEGDRLLPRAAEDAAPARKGLLGKLKAGADRIVDAIADTAASDIEHGIKSRPAATPATVAAKYTPSTTVTAVEKFSRTKAALGMGALAAAGWGLYEYNRRQEQPSQDLPLPPR